MASGSYFVLLKPTDQILTDEQIMSFNLVHAKGLDLWGNLSDKKLEEFIPNLQNTLPFILDTNENEDVFSESLFYSRLNGNVFERIFTFNFLSDFSCLKDYFEMNPFDKSGEIEISEYEAYKMLEALKYIKNPDLWSHTIESSILDRNVYLKVFDELDSNFFSRFDSDSEWIYEENYSMDRLIDTLSTFLSIVKNQGDVKLIYKTW